MGLVKALKQNLFYMTRQIPNILLSLHATRSQRSRGHHKFASGSNLLQHGAQSAPGGPDLSFLALVRVSFKLPV